MSKKNTIPSEVDESVLEEYANLASFSSKEQLLIDKELNQATLEALLDNEPDDEMASFIKIFVDNRVTA